MTETAKSKTKNFKNQITEKFNVGEANGFRTYIGKLSPINALDMLDDIERSVSTDKFSVEKLQEQLNTAKKYIEHVIGTIKHDGHLGTIQTDWVLPDLEKALAAIGGDDD
ncbi:hypothetical protein [Lactococcus lactis]|uniref:hypothetical protein n=1 Tax=Lactococcus lactis TaxID=1358 RepID=UPI003D26E711